MNVNGRTTHALGLLAAAALAALGMVAAGQAASTRGASTTPSYVFWVNSNNTIGRADADGTNVNNNLISVANQTGGLAADSHYVYWANEGSQIGRASVDGSDPNQSFISGTSIGGSSDPSVAGGQTFSGNLAVDSQHIYWATTSSIARANLDGSNVDETFITGVSANSVAVDSQYIYWDTGCAIGRANLDGSNVEPTFITGLAQSNNGTRCLATGVAVDSHHIFWSWQASGEVPTVEKIWRANLDGTGLNEDFIEGAGDGLATDGQHIYWGGNPHSSSSIGRASLDGSGVDQSFLTGTAVAYQGAIAVSPPGTPPTTTGTTTTGTTTPTPNSAVTVLVKVKGNGHVSGGNVRCPSACKATVAKGSPVTLHVHASRGYRFAGWSGACPNKVWGLGACTLAVYLHSGQPRTEAKIAGQSLWEAFATPNSAGAVKATATFVRRRG